MIIQVGKVLIQVTAKQLPKFLTRFRGAKQIKNPTAAQTDKARKITGNLENFSKADKKTLKNADTARPTIMQSLTGTGRTGAQETAKKGLKGTGESRRSFAKGAGAATGTIFTVGAGGKIIYDLTKGADRGEAKADTPPTPLRKPKDLIKKKEEKKFNLKTGGKGTAKERLEEIQKEKLAAKQKALTGNTGLLASKKDLKPIPAGKKGKGLSMLSTSVRNNMGFMYGGGMPMPSKKPRMSNTDYRKASKGMLIISIDMKKKKKGKGKKA